MTSSNTTRRPEGGHPRIVAICGSTKFRAEIADANRALTLAGYIVVAPGVFAHDGDEITEQQKAQLDELHLQKIDVARWIYVVNPGGYIGESTRREIKYAHRTGKGVLTLVDVGIPGWSPEARAEAAALMAARRAALAAVRAGAGSPGIGDAG
jgi:dienelactone hydrolase